MPPWLEVSRLHGRLQCQIGEKNTSMHQYRCSTNVPTTVSEEQLEGKYRTPPAYFSHCNPNEYLWDLQWSVGCTAIGMAPYKCGCLAGYSESYNTKQLNKCLQHLYIEMCVLRLENYTNIQTRLGVKARAWLIKKNK